jgi:16S rRNA G966 N2-methylase RsmD
VAENILYYGDNLDVLRQHVKDEIVDLVYLDPPFNSAQDYNVLFAEHGTRVAMRFGAIFTRRPPPPQGAGRKG